MRNNSPSSDAQAIWQNQSTEEIKMSLEQFKHKAEHLRVKARLTAIANYGAYLTALAFLGFEYMTIPNPISRAGLVLLIVGSLYVVWRAHKQLWPLSAAPDVTGATGLEAYRRELKRSRDHNSNVWKMVAPLIPGSIVFALPSIAPLLRKALEDPKVVLTNALPFCVLFAIWLVFLLPVRRRNLRKIQGEIDTLDQWAHSGPDLPDKRGTI